MFLISDTHLDHENIIKYCGRPFSSLEQMDRTIIENWNKRVSNDDIVLFGGDVAMAREEVAFEYANQLHGTLVSLIGNHDDFDVDSAPFEAANYLRFVYPHSGTTCQFYYSHYPGHYAEQTNRDDDRIQPQYAIPPDDFRGVNLHGHVHNNDTEQFPLYNPHENTVNLSAELLGYAPLKLSELIEIIEQDEWYTSVADVPNDVYDQPDAKTLAHETSPPD